MARLHESLLCMILFLSIEAEGDFACKLLGNFGLPSIFKQGDVMLGGIFPVFNKEENRNVSFKKEPHGGNCVR